MFRIVNVESDRGALARSILTALPDWFGIPEAVEDYVAACDHLPMLAADIGEGTRVGFLALKRHTDVAAEAYVLGVLREHHRCGIGKALFAAAEQTLRRDGVRYLTDKTLAASDPDPNYAATRKYYEAIGFDPIEVFPTLWNPENPCLFMLKRLA